MGLCSGAQSYMLSLVICASLHHLGAYSYNISSPELTKGSERRSLTITAVGNQCSLGEGPFWDAETQSLYYVDIAEQKVHKYDPATQKDTYVEIEGGQPSFVIPVKGEKNKLLVSMTHSLAIVTWDGESTTPTNTEIIATVEANKTGNRFNDGKAAPDGALWAGTMVIKHGSYDAAFYSFWDPKSPVKQLDPVGEFNGLIWTRDMKNMYYIDTETYKVEVFDLDSSKRALSNRRTVIDFSKDKIIRPDGMTMDAEGKLWVANANGSNVIRIDPVTGTIMETLEIPSRKVTCMVFGGPNLDQLFVTTSRNFTMTGEERVKWPWTGYTFQITGLGVKGYAGDRVSFMSHSASSAAATLPFGFFIVIVTAIMSELYMHGVL